MKKCAKAFISLVLVVGLMGVMGGLTSCSSSRSATMYPTKKYKSSKVVKSNISVRGTNKKNGSTYHSY
ncbi:MAG: hypothetical protein SPM02_06615 [Bacteroidales bacterium]|nr:hypothetical protein [Bacteroidales bacterium]